MQHNIRSFGLPSAFTSQNVLHHEAYFSMKRLKRLSVNLPVPANEALVSDIVISIGGMSSNSE
jgi:hypothetical protein